MWKAHVACVEPSEQVDQLSIVTIVRKQLHLVVDCFRMLDPAKLPVHFVLEDDQGHLDNFGAVKGSFL